MASDVTTTLQQSDHDRGLLRAYLNYIGQPNPPLRPRLGEPDDNLIISLGRLICDKGASFLFGQPVTSQVTDAQPEPKQDWLDECWRRNKRAITLLKLATNGGIYGHAFLRVVARPMFPRLVVLDPRTVEITTDPEDVDAAWKFVIAPPPFQAGQEQQRRRTIISNPSGQAGERVDADLPWQIVDQTFSASTWVTTATAKWPYPFPPILHCQNIPRPNDVWGESDLPEDVLKILEGINRVASHYQKIVRIHAHPKVWTRGMGKQTLDVGIDSVIHLPSETAELKALEMQSDLSSTMALLDKLLNLLSMMTRIPLVAMGMPDNLGAISGVALQIRYQPLIEKTEAKRLTYGDMLTELDRCLLMMGEFGENVGTQLQWPEMLPIDPLLERQLWVLDQSLGLVSRETLAEKAGYDYEAETERMANEKQQLAALGLTAPAVTNQADGEAVAPVLPFGAPGTNITPHITK